MRTVNESKPKGWRPPSGLVGAVFWLAAWFCLLLLLRLIPGSWGTFFSIVQVLVGIALAAVAIPLLVRIVRRRMLWSLRNKLVVTYLLIGLAPVVLFVTLVLVSAYVTAGQFSIHLADSRIQEELGQMATENSHRIGRMAELIQSRESPPAMTSGAELTNGLNTARQRLHRETSVYINGAPADPGRVRTKTPLGLPAWAADLKGSQFQGLVLDGSDLYLAVVDQRRTKDGRLLSIVESLIVDRTVMDMIASGLGHVQLFAEPIGSSEPDPSRTSADQQKSESLRARARDRARSARNSSVAGGTQPSRANLADIEVHFLSTIGVTDWDTGEHDNIPIKVDSRPSQLYYQLFGASLGGVVTSAIRVGLIVLCVLFGLIELLALIMAIRLSRTMTASVADLYDATLRIDKGEFSHRIGVTREDQLAELSRSFNKMTGSMQRLLEEQKEKERLQNELSIAQEVQANLFPRQIASLPTLELHGICRPARSVSGDYYDFLVFHEEAHNGCASRRETGVGIAIGDISGKGISAALLMATLHSAVRAYRFASEELVFSESAVAGLLASRDDRGGGDGDELFQSPGRILSLLNRHLYRSTQPEKYATLFLAHYDAASSMLTYSNAGQLPPLVLGRDNVVRRLDRGGTVVGLMDGMRYEEGRFQMRSGDIVVAYSDGVTEPENDFGEFGEERLMEVVSRYRDQPLHVISSQVMQALDAWIGADEQPDDITLVLARQV